MRNSKFAAEPIANSLTQAEAARPIDSLTDLRRVEPEPGPAPAPAIHALSGTISV